MRLVSRQEFIMSSTALRNVPLRKTIVTRHALRVVLKRGLDKRQAQLCGARRCSVRLPVYAIPSSRGAANWQLRAPKKCARGCDSVLHGIQKELRGRYELVPAPQKRVPFAAVIAGLVGLSGALYFVAWMVR
jgi:hypothetical protein